MFCPYLDERVIEYCLKLPVDRRVGKKILRSIAGRLVPQEVITREKRVFIVPMGTWMKDSLKPFVDLVFSEKNLEKRGIFNVMEMIKLKGSFDRGEFQSWSDIWSFVLLEAWLRINYDKAFPEKPENVHQIFPELEMPRNISNP
jgi:asparagine synthase (glutamine-hydrolysing)